MVLDVTGQMCWVWGELFEKVLGGDGVGMGRSEEKGETSPEWGSQVLDEVRSFIWDDWQLKVS